MNLLINPVLAAITLLLAIDAASAEPMKRRRFKMRSDHAHGTAIGGHSHSMVGPTFGAGTAYTQSFAKKEKEEGHSQAEGGHSHGKEGHSHSLGLHGGHSHAGGGEGGGGGESGLMAYVRPGYQIKTVGVGVNAAFVPKVGLLDPQAELTHELLINSKTEVVSAVSATASLSKVSKKMKKTTTLGARVGPMVTFGKFSISLTGNIAYHLYSEELEQHEEDEGTTLALTDDGHNHDHGGEHEDEKPKEPAAAKPTPTSPATGNKPVQPAATQPKAAAPKEADQKAAGEQNAAKGEEEEEHEHDRPNMDMGGGLGVGYGFNQKFRTDHGVGVTMSNTALGKNLYTTTLNVISASLMIKNFTTYGTFGIASKPEEDGISAPKNPVGVVGLDFRL